jgi:branched-chain amino acid transport system substrate-binding protein
MITFSAKAMKIHWAILALAIIVFCSLGTPFAVGAGEPTGEPLRIGTLGVTSGNAASWGLISKYAAMTSAKIWNAEGGLLVDGVRHPVEIYSADTKLDPKIARLGAEKLVYRDKVRFIIGPNTDPPLAAALEVTTPAKVPNIGYGFAIENYDTKWPYSIFGMIASYQSCSVLYEYIMEKYNVKTLSLVCANNSFWIGVKDKEVEQAKQIGLKVLADDAYYEYDTTDFFPLMSRVLKDKPDAIEITIAGSGHAAQMTKALRQLGYKGIIFSPVAGDEKIFNEIGGKYMEGFIDIGGATTADMATAEMQKYIEVYKEIAGEWNDEAATKIYAMEMLRATIQQAGAAALTDGDAFVKAMPEVEYKNPYIQGNPTIKYVGKKQYGKLAQIGVPLVLVQMKGGKFDVVKVTSLEE